MDLRLADSSEIDVVLSLVQLLYVHEGIAFDQARTRDALARLMANPQTGGVWLMHEQGVVAGYMVLTTGYSIEFGGDFMLVDELYVAEDSRGRGFAKQGLAFAEAEARRRGADAVRLEAEVANTAALNLYRDSGFVTHERYPMTKRIK
jgi:ribosomal protein S18 acetylase RimI-like enzyme